MNLFVVNIVFDDILNIFDVIIVFSSIVFLRFYVEYFFYVNVDQVYEYVENSILILEERVGMFYMRVRILQIELEKKCKVVSLNYIFILNDS